MTNKCVSEGCLPVNGKSLEEITREALEESKAALKNPYIFQKPITNVAVIGAGPSGLCSARHLKDLGFNVRVFERNSTVGGLWIYSQRAPPKPKIPSSRITRETEKEALELTSKEVQKRLYEMTPEVKDRLLNKCPPSACYRDLYTNTATDLSGFPDFPFPEGLPRFCPHHDVLHYIQDYAAKFDLLSLIEFDTSVDLVRKHPEDDQTWELTLCKYEVYESGMVRETRWKETFDAVVIANGCYQDPFVPDFKHLTEWNKLFPSKISHSKQFRQPEDFKDKNVLVIGGSISAIDIVRSLEGFAKTITMTLRGPFESLVPILNVIRSKIPKSVIIKPNIASFSNENDKVDGTIVFEDGTALDNIDHIIFCTGFMDRMPFLGDLVIEKGQLEEANVFTTPRPIYDDDVPDSHVVKGPKVPLNVYREIFLMSDPTLTFVGISPYFVTWSHFDTQAQAVARVWSGHSYLPNKELMQKFTSEHNSGLNPYELFNIDRRRREPYIVWLNYHEEEIQTDDTARLPKLENYREDYEEEYQKIAEIWGNISDENFKRARAYINEHYL
ncbi:uncharacterized protein BX663DRAFT_491014 [Cokeromyces recurvatus]|uniref:uncharacterized protein n=1 Tax=Cokeromyces recurvatus TaxID=90255 RepID=UPI00221F872D|nr:uncharacterized protein BX663DRAFT_491014 [Cokeromyces recurvatus]KAI7907466.1 hypothetical protein BX663DRAFT_491014 [Cokeromyces recurvatus]